MQTKHSHGLVILLGVAVVVVGAIYFGRPEAGDRGGKFKTYVDKGLTEEMRAEFDVRIATLKASIEADEKPDISKYLRLGNLYYQTGELGLAKEAYEKILELNPEDVAARENLGTALVEMGDYKYAERVWAESLERSGNIFVVVSLVDLINEHIPEDKPRVKEILELAIQSLGQDPSLLSRLGDWYLENGDVERAISHYEVAKSLSPSPEFFEEKIREARKVEGRQ